MTKGQDSVKGQGIQDAILMPVNGHRDSIHVVNGAQPPTGNHTFNNVNYIFNVFIINFNNPKPHLFLGPTNVHTRIATLCEHESMTREIQPLGNMPQIPLVCILCTLHYLLYIGPGWLRGHAYQISLHAFGGECDDVCMVGIHI